MADRKDVYHIKDLGDGKKAIWTKIGSAFVNKDGSINCFLECLPVDGRLHIRDPKEKKVYKKDEPPADNYNQTNGSDIPF